MWQSLTVSISCLKRIKHFRIGNDSNCNFVSLLRNHCNIFLGWWSYPLQKRRENCMMHVFPPFLVWIPPSAQKILQRFLIILFRRFDFDVSVANDVAIDVAKCALPGKVMQWSPCPEVRTLTNENGRYIMKLNDLHIPFGFSLFDVTFWWMSLLVDHGLLLV